MKPTLAEPPIDHPIFHVGQRHTSWLSIRRLRSSARIFVLFVLPEFRPWVNSHTCQDKTNVLHTRKLRVFGSQCDVIFVHEQRPGQMPAVFAYPKLCLYK
ncbi:hypothetical protein PGTUg99_024913 [Puccinia graminis f. sp. tritici]|uniref:Uncharacterized protein n=1 Tax=Puccinia graminis f. sp. tritici TaxID=56615 RepID=A0A5B0Q4G6_PUCGR|nr:hypothetical protein PGTUg99_024913 [Puccinia graminis f. sp. tritici]